MLKNLKKILRKLEISIAKNSFIETLFKHAWKVVFKEYKKEVYLFKIKLSNFLLTIISITRKIKRKVRLKSLLIQIMKN